MKHDDKSKPDREIHTEETQKTDTKAQEERQNAEVQDTVETNRKKQAADTDQNIVLENIKKQQQMQELLNQKHSANFG